MFGKSLNPQFINSAVARCPVSGEMSTTKLPTKWAHNLLFADKLAKFAVEILLHCKKCLTCETQYIPWGFQST